MLSVLQFAGSDYPFGIFKLFLLPIYNELHLYLYHCQDFYRTWLYISVTQRVFYNKQELLSPWGHLSSPRLLVGSVLLFSFLRCVFVLYIFVLCLVTNTVCVVNFVLTSFIFPLVSSNVSHSCCLSHTYIEHYDVTRDGRSYKRNRRKTKWTTFLKGFFFMFCVCIS